MDCNNRTLFVGNLGPGVTEALLRELFLQAGPIDQIRLPFVNGVPKTFAHVVYRYESSVNYAVDVFRGTAVWKQELLLQPNNPQHDSGYGRFPPQRPNNYRDRDEMKEVPSRGNPYRDERSDGHSRGNPYRDGRSDGHYRVDPYRDGRHAEHRRGNSYRDDRDEPHSRNNHHRDRRNENPPRNSRSSRYRDHDTPPSRRMK